MSYYNSTAQLKLLQSYGPSKLTVKKKSALVALSWNRPLTVRLTHSRTNALLWSEMRLVWESLNDIKSHTMLLSFWLQTGMNWIFQMRYCRTLYLKRLQNCRQSKLEFKKNSRPFGFEATFLRNRYCRFGLRAIRVRFPVAANFGHPQFWRPLTYRAKNWFLRRSDLYLLA